MESAFGVDHGEVSKGLRKFNAKLKPGPAPESPEVKHQRDRMTRTHRAEYLKVRLADAKAKS